MIFLSTLLISMFITMALIPIFRTLALRMNNGLDIPNERKVHAKPMPKAGGIAMAIGALVDARYVLIEQGLLADVDQVVSMDTVGEG